MSNEKYDLGKEIRIKIQLRRTDDHIIDDLLKDGFSLEDISNELRRQRAQGASSYRWLMTPLLMSSAVGGLLGMCLVGFQKIPLYWGLISGTVAMSALLILYGSILMARGICESKGFWGVLSLFHIRGIISSLTDLDADDRKTFDEGFVVFGIGLCCFVIGPLIIGATIGIPKAIY